jgi:hypothetical protein
MRIDLGPGEEGQQHGANCGQEVDPLVARQASQVAGGDTDEDLDQRDADPEADRDERREQGQADPRGRDQEDVVGHQARSATG